MPSKLFPWTSDKFSLATLAMNTNSRNFPKAIEQGWHCG